METASRFSVEFGESSLAGLSWGEGPAVLLAHGWEGRGSQMGAIGQALAEVGLRAVAYDAPAHGDSSGDHAALWQFSNALDAMVAREGPFVGFVGHSFGVAAACHSFQRGSVTTNELGSRLVFMAPPDDLRRWVQMLYSMLGLGPQVQRAFETTMEESLGFPWAEACRSTVLAPQDVPLLVVHDSEDRDTPLEAAQAVAAAWPQSRMLTSSGLGHNRILRDPEVLGGLAEFVSH